MKAPRKLIQKPIKRKAVPLRQNKTSSHPDSWKCPMCHHYEYEDVFECRFCGYTINRTYILPARPRKRKSWCCSAEERSGSCSRCQRKFQTSKEYIKGGLGDGKPNSAFNQHQLAMGIKVEMEHTSNPKISAEIARDHLTEFAGADYYGHLTRMENDMKLDMDDMRKKGREHKG